MRVIALGSSFAAGPGIAPQVDKDAGRSGNNYPSVFARKLGLDADKLLDFTVSGATLTNVLSEPQMAGSKTFAPQLSLLDGCEKEEPTVVTVTGGGNDMFYIGSMFDRTLRRTWWGRILRWFMSAEQKASMDNPTIATPEKVTERFRHILDQVHRKLPQATIYLVEYFAVVGPDTLQDRQTVFTKAELDDYRDTANLLQRIYQDTARGRPYCHIVPLADESYSGHALGSKEPWVTGCSLLEFYRGGAFHPNAAGMLAAADRVYAFHTKLQSLNEQ